MANLEAEADRVFSIYIRLTYADFRGYIRCYTCDIVIPWQEAQCGHFIVRGHDATRYDEENCRPQCRDCNEFKNGMPESFEEHLRDDLGDEAVDALIQRGRSMKQISDEEYRQIIQRCKALVRAKGVIL